MSSEKMEVQELVEQGKVLYSLDKYDEALELLKKQQNWIRTMNRCTKI